MSEQKLPDIVERLHAEATTIEYQVRGQDPGDWKEIGLMREAASEIKRFRSLAPAEDGEETIAYYKMRLEAAHEALEIMRGNAEDGEGLREALVRIEIITASGRTTELLAKMAQVNALARAALFSGRDGRKCPSMMLAPGSFSGGPQVPCTGIKTAEGVTGGCGEPCSFVMERS